jgi:hypothetical protein
MRVPGWVKARLSYAFPDRAAEALAKSDAGLSGHGTIVALNPTWQPGSPGWTVRRPIPDRATALYSPAPDSQVAKAGCPGLWTVAGHPRHRDEARPPLVPVGAVSRVLPPARQASHVYQYRTPVLVWQAGVQSTSCATRTRVPPQSSAGLHACT